MSLDFLKRSLHAKVTIGTALPLILILGFFTGIEHSRHRNLVLSHLSALASYSGQVIESSLQHAMLESDFTQVQGILDTIGESGEFQVVYLLDPSGKVIFAPDNVGVGLLLDNRQPDCQPCHHLAVNRRPESVVVRLDDGQRVFRSMQPIENTPRCARCHDATQPLLGVLLTDIPMGPMETVLADDLRENLLWSAITVLVGIIIANVVVSRFVLRRLSKMAGAMAVLGHGELPSHLSEGSPDEIGQLARAFNHMAQQVQTRERENRDLSEDLRQQGDQQRDLLKRLISAQEDERKRIARELHDRLGQFLAGLALQTSALERLITQDTPRAIQQLGQIRALTTETTDRMYNLILDLRPSVLDDLGLVAALRVYSQRLLDGTGISIEMDVGGLAERLPPEYETVLYRVYQEALVNIVRHAHATRIQITLACHAGRFEGQVIDDGQGFDPDLARPDGQSAHGLGLLGMQERLLQCQGRMEIVSHPGQGTQLFIFLPLAEGYCD
jgi:signal transduction histidine kinase